MRALVAVCAISLFLVTSPTLAQNPPAAPGRYEELRAKAESFYAEGSYQLAQTAYIEAQKLELPPAAARWVNFRVADTLWRAQAATKTADGTKYERAQRDLEALLVGPTRPEDRDLVWAEAQESLGDFHWRRPDSQDWSGGWQHYSQALDWWSGSADLATARTRYLGIVRKALLPLERSWRPIPFVEQVPFEVLENTARIAEQPADVALAHYALAQQLQNSGEFARLQRVPADYEAALKAGKNSDWYDHALFEYAQWLANSGPATPLPEGGYRRTPDYPKALEYFRRLIAEFGEGKSQFYEQAKNWIEGITSPAVNIDVAQAFLPDSLIQVQAGWRNVSEITFNIYAVTLVEDVNFEKQSWEHGIDLSGRPKLKSWTRKIEDKHDYQPAAESITLDDKLPPGAYVIELAGGGKTAQDLILVSDATAVLQTAPTQALVYVCDVVRGAPLADASVLLWETYSEWINGKAVWHAHKVIGKTDENGLARLKLDFPQFQRTVYAAALAKERQAFARTNATGAERPEAGWRIYACSDRPAYRPGDTAKWKITARLHTDQGYETPAHRKLKYKIMDARQGVLKEGDIELNAFGSAWGELPITDKMPLGPVMIQFRETEPVLGQAALFRLEEYKLPEFKVTVETPKDEQGGRKVFRVGDTVEVAIQADYYFGGGVGNADIHVRLYQSPFLQHWKPPHEYPWLYERDWSDRRWGGRWGGNEQMIKEQDLKTDANGHATLSFETPAGGQQDFEYRIEAKVTDASRREIEAEGKVRVTRQKYYAHLTPEHNIYRPQDKIRIDIVTQNADEKPVSAEGEVRVCRQRWFEIWIDPQGKELKGDELTAVQRSIGPIFPPPPKPNERGWRLKFRGYEQDEISKQTLKTDKDGKAVLTFAAERDGYYQIAWAGPDPGYDFIRGEAMVWVATRDTHELGYHPGGVEIVIDKDTFRTGQTAPVMLATSGSDRYVLFSTSANDFLSYQVVHVTGNAKLVELKIDDSHVPNFYLHAAMVSGQELSQDQKEIVVPPAAHFLTVEVEADKPVYEPRQEGTLTVRTRDRDGKPVAAEVALALIDESIFCVQQDYAGDPREFYFSDRRYDHAQSGATLSQLAYRRLVREEARVIDERELGAAKPEMPMNGPAGVVDNLSVFDARHPGGGGRMAPPRTAFAATGGRAADFDADGTREALYLGARFEVANRSMGRMRALADMKDALAKPASGRSMYLLSMDGSPKAPPFIVPESAVQVRSDFRATAFWQPDVATDADGVAIVKVKYPDTLTGWQATARAATAASQFGLAKATTRTRQPLICRLQAPRFFVVGDTVTISAVLNNNTDTALNVLPTLTTDGVQLEGRLKDGKILTGAASNESVSVPANGETRIDWRVRVTQPGAAKFKAMARSDKHADAMEQTYPIFEHGLDKLVAKSGKVRADGATVKLAIPKERKPETTTLSVQVTPSLAVTMLDALPYLIDYPYGCTEQTMSRFLPAVITAKTLKDLGLPPETVATRLFGGMEHPASQPSPELGARPPVAKSDQDIAAERKAAMARLDDVVQQSLKRLYDFQHADGGWSWWKGDASTPSDNFMSAYVLWGLALARDAGISIDDEALKRGIAYLDKKLVNEEQSPDMQAWMLHAVLAAAKSLSSPMSNEFRDAAYANIFKQRDALNAYTRALLAIAAHALNKADDAQILVRNLENGVQVDERPDTSVVMEGPQASHEAVIPTAHWGNDGIYYHWSEGGEEATAFVLRALMTIDPNHKLIEPTTNWLIKNRRGAQWRSTRATAIVVLAMNDYLRTSGELKADLSYELLVNGQSIATRSVTPAGVFAAPSRFDIDPKLIRDGDNEIRIRRTAGQGPLYFAAEARFFTLEEPIPPAGNEIFVRRQYYRLKPQQTLLKGIIYERVPLNDGEQVTSGDRVESVVTIESKNDYEYLVFEDLKPAGLETVQVRSGEPCYIKELKSGTVERQFGTEPPKPGADVSPTLSPPQQTAASGQLPAAKGWGTPAPEVHMRRGESDYTGRSRWVHQELRDRQVALFVDKLPTGVWELRYELRAEVPGEFHALPTCGYAMYVPEIRCNGTEIRLHVIDK